jgi:hypothetical protein
VDRCREVSVPQGQKRLDLCPHFRLHIRRLVAGWSIVVRMGHESELYDS